MLPTVFTVVMFYGLRAVVASRIPVEILEVPQLGGQRQPHNESDYLRQHSLDHIKGSQRPIQATGRAYSPEIRMFYQVGNSENDLPICAPNAVCSKIDLYEKPWIERQCRCPNKHFVPENFRTTLRDISESNKSNEIFRDRKLTHLNKHQPSSGEDKSGNIHFKMLLQKLESIYRGNEDEHEDLNIRNMHLNEALKNNDYAISNHDVRLRHFAHYKDNSNKHGCPNSIGFGDGHTLIDKTRHYKLCDPVHKLPICRYFRDYTWTLSIFSDLNVTEQIVHCRCPPNSVTYLTNREPLGSGKTGYMYLFACSPQSRLRCQRKEPCTLFTVRKRQEFLDEVNTNPLCLCPKGHHCPRHHTEAGVIPGKNYIEDNIHTYSGYCMTNG